MTAGQPIWRMSGAMSDRYGVSDLDNYSCLASALMVRTYLDKLPGRV